MKELPEWMSRFINQLVQLKQKDDRASLARLKRGLGKEPGEAPEALAVVLRCLHLGDNEGRVQKEDVAFLVATLYATHPEHNGQSGNLGDSFRILEVSDSIEKRFTWLLAASDNTALRYRLRQTISLLASKDIAINYTRLLYDLSYWTHDERFVQRAWARSYWGKVVSLNEPGGELESELEPINEEGEENE